VTANLSCSCCITMPDGAAGLCLAVTLMMQANRLSCLLHQEKQQHHQLRMAMVSLQQSESDLQKKFAKTSQMLVSKCHVSNHCETFAMCHERLQWSRPCVYITIRNMLGLCDVNSLCRTTACAFMRWSCKTSKSMPTTWHSLRSRMLA